MLFSIMKRLAIIPGLILIALLVQTTPLHAQARLPVSGTLSVVDQGAWRTVQKGVEWRKLALVRSEPSYQLEVKLLRFEPQWILARVLTSGELQMKSATAKSFVERSGAIAAINANYFDERGRPLAYLKTENTVINRAVSNHALYTGVFAIVDGHPAVLHRDDFTPAQASAALQSGPLLLNRGAPVETMRGLGRYARRTVIGIDKEGRMIIAVTDAVLGGLSFVELQELFGNPKWQLDTPDLLNLDGGGSSQLHFKSGKLEESVPGTSEVPVAIGFFVKAN